MFPPAYTRERSTTDGKPQARSGGRAGGQRSAVTTPSAATAPVEAQRSHLGPDALYSVALAAACYVSYWLTRHVLSEVRALASADDQLGGLFAVVSTVFVYRTRYQQDVTAALARMSATLFSFVLCLAYLLVLRPTPVWLAVLVGIGTFTLMLIGRSDDVITAGITVAVVMVVAQLAPHHAWRVPIVQLAGTMIGVAVGLAAGLVGSRLGTLD